MKSKVYDISLTVVAIGSDSKDFVGTSHVLKPRANVDGFCKLGRLANNPEFQPPSGLCFQNDYSVSNWHGKLVQLNGVIYYTDLGTKNGSKINGTRVAKDTLIPLKNNDIISMGDAQVKVKLILTKETQVENEEGEGASALQSKISPPKAPKLSIGKGKKTNEGEAASTVVVEEPSVPAKTLSSAKGKKRESAAAPAPPVEPAPAKTAGTKRARGAKAAVEEAPAPEPVPTPAEKAAEKPTRSRRGK